jgi:predicted O-linked N-acetylglucosamine transferase (SPINDLY family)
LPTGWCRRPARPAINGYKIGGEQLFFANAGLWIQGQASADDPEQRPLLLLALNNLGRHYEDKGRMAEALACLTASLRVQPLQPDVIHHWVFLRAKQCLWPVYDPLPGLDEATMREYTSALAMISLSEDPAAQLAAARQYVKNKVRTDVPRLAPDQPYGHDGCASPTARVTSACTRWPC